MLYFIAYRVLGDHADAEDAVRSCILSIRRKVPSLEHEGGFRAWLVRVLINEAVAILRKNRLRSVVKGRPRDSSQILGDNLVWILAASPR